MQFELTIRGDSFEEIASIFTRNVVVPGASGEEARGPEPRAKEVEPETPKKPRGKKGAAAAESQPQEPTASDASKPTKPSAEVPSEGEPVTFEDLRAKASSLMDSGKADGRAIQEMLQAKFGVKAFGPLPEDKYPEAMAELENLAA